MRIGSLFAGIGGLDLGLERAGVGRTIWQVEREPFCREILARHWPDAVRHDDVCTVGAHNLAPVDLICGGFPCQDLSYAGKGAGLDGARSGLWREYARIVGELRPRFVVVENVQALATRGLDRVCGDLAGSGYRFVVLPVSAADVGAPHLRRRIFIVGWRGLADAKVCAGVNLRGAGRDACSAWTRRAGHAASAGDCMDHPDSRGLRRAGALADQGVADDDRSRGERLRQDGDDIGQPDGSAEPVSGRARKRAHRLPQPRMGRAVDGLPAELDRWPARPGEPQAEWEAPRVAQVVENRAARLKALGNAVVPAVGYVVGCVVMQIADHMEFA